MPHTVEEKLLRNSNSKSIIGWESVQAMHYRTISHWPFLENFLEGGRASIAEK